MHPTILLLLLLATLTTSQIHTIPLQSHSTILQRRRRRLQKTSSSSASTDDDERQVASLYQGIGTHYADLYVGSPHPQRQTVIVDTGSPITSFPCTGCTDCGRDYHADDVYDTSLSKTFQSATCSECRLGSCQSSTDTCYMKQFYAEGSGWYALEARDVTYTGASWEMGNETQSKHSFELDFGCQTSITGLFQKQLADGIMGMSLSKNSFWNQMYDAGLIQKKVFSLCFLLANHHAKEGIAAGAMTLGGVEPKLWDSPLVYAKASGFQVRLRHMYFWSAEDVVSRLQPSMDDEMDYIERIGEDGVNEMALMDSGTTDTYFGPGFKSSFMKAFRTLVGVDFNAIDSHSLTEEQAGKLPTILIQIEGVANEDMDPDTTTGLAGALDPEHPHDVIIAIPPVHYVMKDYEDDTLYTTISFESYGSGTLGSNTFRGHDVVFDVENSRIGFAQSECVYGTLDDVEKESPNT